MDFLKATMSIIEVRVDLNNRLIKKYVGEEEYEKAAQVKYAQDQLIEILKDLKQATR